MGKNEILEEYPFFEPCSAHTRAALSASARLQRCEAGHRLLNGGNGCTDLMLLGGGRIRVLLAGRGGREATLYYLTPGELCCLNVAASMLGDPLPTDVSVVTADSVHLLMVPSASVRSLINDDVALRDALSSAVVHGVFRLLDIVEKQSASRLEDRVARYLVTLADRAGHDGAEVHATHADIAAEVGSVREVVSRVLKQFQELGAIDLGRGKIRLNDATRLLNGRGGTPLA